MSPSSVLELAAEMAALGMNTLIIEWEASFPFASHPTLCTANTYSRRDVSVILDGCRRLGLDVIPLQQCFGHVEYILQHNRYAALRESPTDLSQVCPSKPDEALELFGQLFEELAAAHQSPYFHLGGDESRLLGVCPKCRAFVRRHGVSRLYVRYLLRLIDAVKSMGKKPIVWADMLLKHPECIEDLPRDLILTDWNYGWKFNRFGDAGKLLACGFEVWGATALRSAPDNHSKTLWARHFENLKVFVPHARASGYTGLIQTSWSTSGEYGYLRENEDIVSKLLPTRRVYPLAGFRILMVAFASTAASARPFDPRTFMARYFCERFGLNKTSAEKFVSLLFEVSDYSQPELILERTTSHLKTLREFSPKANRREFRHLKLMVRMALHGLLVMQLYGDWQEARSKKEDGSSILKRIRALEIDAQSIDKEFRRLHQASLGAAQLDEEMSYRQAVLRILSERFRRWFAIWP